MTEDQFENDLTQALRTSGQGAPTPGDLAGSARERRRHLVRRRTTIVSAACAVALVVGAVSFWPRADHPTSAPSPATSTSSGSTSWIPAGWRTESYGDIELAVPASWKYGDLSQWCIMANPQLPVYDRPGGFSTAVGCMGSGGYGVQFTEPQEVDPAALSDQVDPATGKKYPVFPEGSAVRTKTFGTVMVLLVLQDAALADQVIGTAHTIEAFDTNGCAPTAVVPALGRAATVGATQGQISVCRYSPGARDNLLQSERLDATDSDALRAALDAAPDGRGPDEDRQHCINTGETEVVLLSTATGPLAWIHFTDCTGNAIDLGGTTKKVTPGVMHWALSPGWSGGSSNGEILDDLRALPATP